MNKLEVALKLFHLLNDRKKINSKIVADELNVSLRTAQRYLLELSILPCVKIDDDKRTYSLDDDYKLKDALISNNDHGHMLREMDFALNEALDTYEMFCQKCHELDRSLLDRIGMNLDLLCNDKIHRLKMLQAGLRRVIEERCCESAGCDGTAGRDPGNR